MNKKTTFAAVAGALLIGVCVTYFTSPVRPQIWSPDARLTWEDLEQKSVIPKQSMNGAALLTVHAEGPEDIAFDRKGNGYSGLANGDIIKFSSTQPFDSEVIHNTQGRPLGLRFHQDGKLIIADAIKGLLEVDLSTKTQRVLADSFEGQKLKFTDHVSIASNGDIFFSDASQRFGMLDYVLDFVEASKTGRVFKWHSKTEQISLLMDGLYFANGVALSIDEDYLLVNETGQARILKYWLKGELAGQTDVFIVSLPGLPDNIFRDQNNHFWIGLVTERDGIFESLSNTLWLRRIIAPVTAIWAKTKKQHGSVVVIDGNGKMLKRFESEDHVTGITSAIPHNEKVYLGFLHGKRAAVIDLQ